MVGRWAYLNLVTGSETGPGDSLIAACFISYSHADKPLAQALAAGLRARGYRVWIDQGELKIGDSLVTAISAAIDQVDFLIRGKRKEALERAAAGSPDGVGRSGSPPSVEHRGQRRPGRRRTHR